MKQIIFFGLMAMIALNSCSKKDKENEGDDPGVIIPEVPFDQLTSSERRLVVDGTTNHVNLMGNGRKALPAFASLNAKPGKAIGYVKDSYGRPVANASIGVRASVVGGIYSSAQGTTNEKGYYEIDVPQGNAHYYNAGYSISFEGGRAAVGLYPADGQMASFAAAAGAVENFVLLPYGEGDPAEVATYPYNGNNYFGGCLMLTWVIRENPWPAAGSLPDGMVIDITLIPLNLYHGDEKRTFFIRKTVRGTNLSINNLPIGKYRVQISAPGTRLTLTEVGIHANTPLFGLFPRSGTPTTDSYTHITVPFSADAKMPAPFRSHWDQPAIMVKMVE